MAIRSRPTDLKSDARSAPASWDETAEREQGSAIDSERSDAIGPPVSAESIDPTPAEFYRQILQDLPAALYACDAEGCVTFFNRAAAELWGRAPTIGQNLLCGSWKIYRPDGTALPLDQCPMAIALREKRAVRGEEIIIERPDGSRRHVLSHPDPICDANGAVVGAINMLIDVTEGRLADENQAFLASVVESSDDAIVTKTLEGRITSWNAGAERIFGYRSDEAIGQSIAMLIPDDRQAEETEILSRLRQGERIDHFETIRRHKDGRQLQISLTVSPVRDRFGRIIGISKVARDVTARKLAELALQESERRFRTLASHAPVGIFQTGSHGGNVFVNESWCAMAGLTPAQAYGDAWADAVHPDDRDRVLGDWKAAAAEGRKSEATFRFLHRDGAVTWVQGAAVPLRNDAGELIGYIGNVADITPHKRFEEELREADRRKDEFLALLAHELRNPLAPIRTGLELIRLAGDDRQVAEEVRTMMERQTQQMVRLIDDLLDVNRITRGAIELRRSPVELSSIINDAIDTARPAIDEAAHRLKVLIPPQPILLDADATRLAQVISNLLNNAAKYMARGGEIRLSAERLENHVAVSVADTGIGIQSEMLDRIFDMFTQVDRSIERSQGGLGIGLTLVKRLVELHGGSVEATSGGPGQGSEFKIRLPIMHRAASTNCDSEDGGQPRAGRRRVLVVDDNENGANVLAMLLTALGNEVRACYDGVRAIEIASEFLPDIILLDLGMPNLNGFETARRIRQQSWGKDIVLAALSGWGQDEDKRRTRQAGFDYHFVKPIEPAALQRLLAECEPRDRH
jgi:PAS domain S-box-containing protein